MDFPYRKVKKNRNYETSLFGGPLRISCKLSTFHVAELSHFFENITRLYLSAYHTVVSLDFLDFVTALYSEHTSLMIEFPLIIQNKIKHWKIFNYEEKDWCDLFQYKDLCFRKGYNLYKEGPYWETLCETENISMSKFFDLSKTRDSNYWLYFDYKYMKDVLPPDSPFLAEIQWSDLGLSHLSGIDSTLWIGTKGAHTPCHMDTYGCNLVAQIFGRKLWILIPPNETDSLKPVRIPYEESSIYSSYNFFTPNSNLLNIKNAYKVILAPGDALFVPKHWWHYVENVETAISINVWIPLESDNESRLEEALVRHYVSDICQSLTENDARGLLNPNEYSLLSSPFGIDMLAVFVREFKNSLEKFDSQSDELNFFKDFIEKNGKTLQKMSDDDIRQFIEQKSKDLGYCPSSVTLTTSESSEGNLYKKMINAYCHPKIVSTVKKKLLEM